MSCCDQDLSGCDLKIVQYSIVSVDPYIKDSQRILDGPLTIATSDDMTEADFTAYVIAEYASRHPIDRNERQYIRVCFSVICRLTMPCTDYDKEQVDALRAINRTLRREKGLDRGGNDSALARRDRERDEDDRRRAERLEQRERDRDDQDRRSREEGRGDEEPG